MRGWPIFTDDHAEDISLNTEPDFSELLSLGELGNPLGDQSASVGNLLGISRDCDEAEFLSHVDECVFVESELRLGFLGHGFDAGSLLADKHTDVSVLHAYSGGKGTFNLWGCRPVGCWDLDPPRAFFVVPRVVSPVAAALVAAALLFPSSFIVTVVLLLGASRFYHGLLDRFLQNGLFLED